MPQLDGTGPESKGAMTGQRQGNCRSGNQDGEKQSGFRRGPGARGRGRRFRSFSGRDRF